LAYVRDQSADDGIGNINTDNNINNDGGKDLDDQKEEQDDTYDDLYCPIQTCEQLKEFETLKDLQRHYATYTVPHPSFR